MTTTTLEPTDVYSAGEIARAAGARTHEVHELARAGLIRPLTGAGYFTGADAVIAFRALAGGGGERPLFRPTAGVRREPGLPLAVSGSLHAATVLVVALLTSAGLTRNQARDASSHTPSQLVFLVSPGPGGGGGGGGLKDPVPAPAAQRHGVEAMRSPVAVHRRPPPIVAVRHTPPPRVEPARNVRPDPPPVEKAAAIQPVFAPVTPAAPDPRERAGVTTPAAADHDSHGPGTDGGVGSGRGTGLGEGDGSGIGSGTGGGAGGGPYRPGTGITPPSILREVRPDYTDEGRRRAVEGDVVLEIVVRADGSVGSVKVLQGLGAGLDQRAMDAVRQWRFNPAKRYGTPVDVIVEVAVEFKLR
ncbi:MAG TPA: TonB family protein [Vicinamibacterales bacterium]